MISAVFADGIALILPACARNLADLVALRFVFGAVHGMLNVAMNVNAVEVQRAYGRPIISSFHAVYSIGGFLGAGPTATFAGVAAGAVILAIPVAGGRCHRGGHRGTNPAPPDQVAQP